MIGHRHQASHLVVPQPGAQPFQQARQAFGLCRRAREQLAVGRLPGHQVGTVQAQFQRRRMQRRAGQAFAQQGLQMGGVQRRLGQCQVQHGGRSQHLALAFVQHVQRARGDAPVAGLRPGLKLSLIHI